MKVRGAIIGALLWVMPLVGMGAGAEMQLLDANTDLGDGASLQRGARLYVNYCLGCHSLNFMRYNRLGRDLGIPEELLRESLVPPGRKVVDEMSIAMRPQAAAGWFGVGPPDLSVIARARGADWLYSYLVSFYVDDNPSRPFGVNNVVFQDVGMPHILWSLQGEQTYLPGEVPANAASVHPERLAVSGDVLQIHKSVTLQNGDHVGIVDSLEVTTPGEMQPGEFRKAARDLVNFLAYAGEPAQLVRYRIGVWVLVFIAIFFVLSRALYKEYWKDVH